jgi:adenylate kinase
MVGSPRRYRCVLLFGPPGVGKGTQGKILGRRREFVHLATGDIFRALDRNSDAGRKFTHYSTRGELVPDALTIEVWRDYVRALVQRKAYDPERQILLLDGIPRSLAQAKMLDPYVEPLAVIHLVVANIDEMVHRIKLRAEKESRRDDTDEAVIRNRFDVYERQTAPVLSHYLRHLVHDIDALGAIEEVAARVERAVNPIYAAEFG